MFNKKTVKDINLAGKRVLLRADYNVPVAAGKITDDYRLKQSLATIQFILEQKPQALIIISHMGRPDGRPDRTLSLRPVARHLGELLSRQVRFVSDCVGEAVKQVSSSLKDGGILMLENVRFHPEEEKNSADFAAQIIEATGAEVFVQDGFGVVHRAHATTEAITKLLPSVGGLLLVSEVETISRVMKDPERPLVAVIGGAKIADKSQVLDKFIKLADCLAIGGAIANNFLKAEGHHIGKSVFDNDLPMTDEILRSARSEEARRPFSFLLPVDAVVSTSADGKARTRVVDLAGHGLSDIEAYPKIPARASYSVAADELILDIGPASAAQFAGAIKLARTVVWGGTMGVTETRGIAGAHAPFAHGSRLVAEAMIGASNKHLNKPFSLVGGGDTVGYVTAEGWLEDFNHVSTGGGASLELMAGKKLPGFEGLQDK